MDTLICFTNFNEIFIALNPTKTGINTSRIISSQYFLTNFSGFLISRYATTNSKTKSMTMIQKMTSNTDFISSVMGNKGSEIPNAVCSMLINPKKNIRINVNVEKLNPFLNADDKTMLDKI